MNCNECKFYQQSFCLRYPPTRTSIGDSKFPHVNGLNWCGEYKEKEGLPIVVIREAPAVLGQSVELPSEPGDFTERTRKAVERMEGKNRKAKR